MSQFAHLQNAIAGGDTTLHIGGDLSDWPEADFDILIDGGREAVWVERRVGGLFTGCMRGVARSDARPHCIMSPVEIWMPPWRLRKMHDDIAALRRLLEARP